MGSRLYSTVGAKKCGADGSPPSNNIQSKYIMANTYTQLLVQLVFAVKYRQNLIREAYRELLEQYICGIIRQNQSKPLAIYCNPDHCHVLIGFHPSLSITKMAQDVKGGSSKWINQQPWMDVPFRWQEGYGAFTYARSQLDVVVRYILNQPEHHRKTTFQQEYRQFLEKFDVPYDNRYLFEFFD